MKKLKKSQFRALVLLTNALTFLSIVVLCSIVSCAPSRGKEYYSERYTSLNGCNWTEVTCWSGDRKPENIIYHEKVCRFYFSYGELSVAKAHDELMQNVVLTRNENCVFSRPSQL